ncbi:MAG: hypothetical protein AAF541_05270 [Pseudomonadota bacterium]
MFAQQIQDKLDPLFKVVLKELAEDGDPIAFSFFMDRHQEIRAAESEEDVIQMFIALSQAAFLGAQFTEQQWQSIDLLLAEAESVSAAMTAGDLQ